MQDDERRILILETQAAVLRRVSEAVAKSIRQELCVPCGINSPEPLRYIDPNEFQEVLRNIADDLDADW